MADTLKYTEKILIGLVVLLYIAKIIIHFTLLKKQKHPLLKDVSFFDVANQSSLWRLDPRILFALWLPYFNKDVTQNLQRDKLRKVRNYQTILITFLALLIVVNILR